MKLKGYHKKRKLNVLIYSGSSLNFLDLYVAQGLGCKTVPTRPLKVALADGFYLEFSSKVPDLELRL